LGTLSSPLHVVIVFTWFKKTNYAKAVLFYCIGCNKNPPNHAASYGTFVYYFLYIKNFYWGGVFYTRVRPTLVVLHRIKSIFKIWVWSWFLLNDGKCLPNLFWKGGCREQRGVLTRKPQIPLHFVPRAKTNNLECF